MSLKIKIILYITILVVLSLGTILFYLSYFEYRPLIKLEIVQRINYHLNNKTDDFYNLIRGQTKYSNFQKTTMLIFNASKEVVYLKIYYYSKGWLSYYGAVSQNRIYYNSTRAEISRPYYYIHDNLRYKSYGASKNILSMALSETNNIREVDIPLLKKFDVHEFFRTEEKRYIDATNQFASMIKAVEKEKEKYDPAKLKKIYQPALYYNASRFIKELCKITNTYNAKIEFILSQTAKNNIAEQVMKELHVITRRDFKDIIIRAFPDKPAMIKKDLFTWQLSSLKEVNRRLKTILSRIIFAEKLLESVSDFHEIEINMQDNLKTVKMPVIDNIRIIKLYTAVVKNNKIYGIIETGISDKEITSRIDPIIKNGIIESGLLIILSIGGGLLLALYLIFPIHILNKGATALRRDKSFRIKLKRKDEFGNLANTMNYLSDELTEELKKYEDLYREATEDELTKLMVRRYFMEFLKTELKNAGKEKRPTSLFMTDIDHFKKFNDTYGHQTGDIVLAKVASILLKNSRSLGIRNDIAGRYGGEEFALLLPATTREEALKIAERVRQEIGNMTAQSTDGKELRVTISIGVHTSDDSAITPEEIIKKADKALYQSKENGRNRVTFGT